MSVYHGKVLELVAIENINEKSYLRIKLSSEQEIELFWEVDSDTAGNLMTIFQFDRNHKYRLSLHTTLDTIKKQYKSLLTRTYLDKSDRIYFTCSVNYKNALDSIKNTQSFNHLHKFPFLSSNPSGIDGTKSDQTNNPDGVVIPKGFKLPFKWVSLTAMISVIVTILFGYSNHSYSNKTTINTTTIAHAEAVTVEDKKTQVVSPDTTLVKDDTTQTGLPYIELDDFITYSIPKGYVSLTFDDGPSKYTEKIVNILKNYKVGGTFFFVGNNVKKHPDYVQYVQSNGYSIGSHSMNHLKMSSLSYEQQEDEFIQSTKAIENITNEKVVLFRPPYGALNQQIKDIIHDNQDKIVLWNRDTIDWKTRDADKIFTYVRNTEASGSVILLHESQAVIDALPRIIEYLQDQNLKIVSLQ
ncbi:polysaccharide deacetylase family protein [Brevibacillus fluminis]|uniref:Polysaccharide deacetylase family protein n=1 Tax=Brevibacillus fluminis TaxID=511487 RepID=A0A3M8D5T1_9BACL|nr:polysaccharide deacetylase family protein [Brevibacillus fluminis]RNB83400.1 polysaccharide deacetylase family protein [Brevibacillus fluminis]